MAIMFSSVGTSERSMEYGILRFFHPAKFRDSADVLSSKTYEHLSPRLPLV